MASVVLEFLISKTVYFKVTVILDKLNILINVKSPMLFLSTFRYFSRSFENFRDIELLVLSTLINNKLYRKNLVSKGSRSIL